MILKDLKHIIDAKHTYICYDGQTYLADEIFKKHQLENWSVTKIEPRVYQIPNKNYSLSLKFLLHVYIEQKN